MIFKLKLNVTSSLRPTKKRLNTSEAPNIEEKRMKKELYTILISTRLVQLFTKLNDSSPVFVLS